MMSMRHAAVVAAALLLAAGAAYGQSAAAETARFKANGAEVLDTRTNLVWQRCSVGQTVKGDGCEGEVRTFTWEQAMKAAGRGWRLPTREELEGLMGEPRGIAAAGAFPAPDPLHMMYWSSSNDTPELAWLVSAQNGSSFNGYRTAPNAVRLVKAAK